MLYCFLSFLLLIAQANAHAQATQPQHTLAKADIERWMHEFSNWGRWGKEDQLGAVNLITPGKKKAAARLVREGFTVSLGHDAVTEKAVDNAAPVIHEMIRTGLNSADGASDRFTFEYHGLVHTHMDALCHFFHEGKMYNGFVKEEVTKRGAAKLGIERLKDGLFCRAVLMDIPRLKGRPYLEPGEAIFPEDLNAWEKRAGVKVGRGDILLIRTGRWARRAAKGAWDPSKVAGLHASCARWIKQRDIAILGSDAASDVLPSGIEGVGLPVHQLAMVSMGIWILDNLDLEAVSASAEQRNRWEILLVVSPLRVVGGTGSPINPLAVF